MLSLNVVGKKCSFLEFPFYLWALKTGEIQFKVHLQVAYLFMIALFEPQEKGPSLSSGDFAMGSSVVAYSSTRVKVICLSKMFDLFSKGETCNQSRCKPVNIGLIMRKIFISVQQNNCF